MRTHIRGIPFLGVAAALMFTVACGGKTQDQTTPRDVALPPPATPVEQPPLRDAPPAPPATPPTAQSKPKPVMPPRSTSPGVPATPVPAVTSSPASPAYAFIPAGTEIGVRPSVKVCTNTQKAGDQVSATVADAVMGPDRATIPAGATATLEVVESQFGNNSSEKVRLSLRVVSLAFGGDTYDVTGADVVAPPMTKVRRQSNGDQVKKVAIGAAAGAILGRVVGKNKNATIAGGVAGAAGGAVVAGGTADYDGCIAADVRLTVRLSQSVRVRIVA